MKFSYDQADIRMIARVVGEVTGRRFVVGDQVEGKITVISPGPVRVDEIYPIFLALLEARGYVVVERGGTSFIVPMAEKPSAQSMAALGKAGTSGWQTRLFKLAHTDATEFAKAIEPLVRGGATGGVRVFGGSNQVLVTDTEDSLARIEAILRDVDQPGAATAIEVVPLTHASAGELAREVSVALGGAESDGPQPPRSTLPSPAPGRRSLVVASSQSNSLVLVGTSVQRDEMKRIIQLLDVESTSGQGMLHAISLRFLSADSLAKELAPLIAPGGDKGGGTPPQLFISASTNNNAILVRGLPREVQWVRDLVKELDQMPQQVMVEVLIAEVSFNKQLDLGVEWSTVDLPGDGDIGVTARSRPGTTDTMMDTIAKGVFPQGLSLGVVRGTESGIPDLIGLIRALQENRDVKILSSVPLWAQNNIESSISVVENIPVLRSTIEGGSGTARDVIQNIDRTDVGIKLKITPHITPDGDVTLKLNPSIEAIVDQGSSDQLYTPTIAKREVNTTVTVPDQTTVVISGLIREDRIQREWKIPLLGDIPYLGFLFRYSSDSRQRNNLMVFVTPRIIRSSSDRDAVRGLLQPKAELPDHFKPGGAVLESAPAGAPAGDAARPVSVPGAAES